MLHGNEKHLNQLASSALFKTEVYLFKGRNKQPRFKILSLIYLSKIIINPFLGIFEKHLCLCWNAPCLKKKKNKPHQKQTRKLQNGTDCMSVKMWPFLAELFGNSWYQILLMSVWMKDHYLCWLLGFLGLWCYVCISLYESVPCTSKSTA